MRQTHDVPGSVGHAISHLSARLTVLLTSNYPAKAVVKTMMVEAAPLFPGLNEQDLILLIDCLLDRTVEHYFPSAPQERAVITPEAIPFPLHRRGTPAFDRDR